MENGLRKHQERERYFSFKDLLERLRFFLEKDLIGLTKKNTQTLKKQDAEKQIENVLSTNYWLWEVFGFCRKCERVFSLSDEVQCGVAHSTHRKLSNLLTFLNGVRYIPPSGSFLLPFCEKNLPVPVLHSRLAQNSSSNPLVSQRFLKNLL